MDSKFLSNMIGQPAIFANNDCEVLSPDPRKTPELTSVTAETGPMSPSQLTGHAQGCRIIGLNSQKVCSETCPAPAMRTRTVETLVDVAESCSLTDKKSFCRLGVVPSNREVLTRDYHLCIWFARCKSSTWRSQMYIY